MHNGSLLAVASFHAEAHLTVDVSAQTFTVNMNAQANETTPTSNGSKISADFAVSVRTEAGSVTLRVAPESLRLLHLVARGSQPLQALPGHLDRGLGGQRE